MTHNSLKAPTILSAQIPVPNSASNFSAYTSTIVANNIVHVVMVIDASSSMSHLAPTVVKVVDAQIAYLAKRSQELQQETRITVYVFASHDNIKCVIYDMDVLRLPSIATYYRPGGRTALIDATMLALTDLAETPQKYGNHAFLLYVFTDGEENDSKYSSSYSYRNIQSTTPAKLNETINTLPENWTVAAFVPNQVSKHEAKNFGFPADNIAIWSTDATGMEEAGEVIRQATDNYMVAVASSATTGFRGTKSLFSMDATNLNRAAVRTAKLKALTKTQYTVVKVGENEAPEIRSWVLSKGLTFQIGKAFYQLTKTEDIQAQKAVCVRDKKTGKFYSGPEVREILGLPDMTVRVKPTDNPTYDVFVQSTSTNRKLVPNTDVLILA